MKKILLIDDEINPGAKVPVMDYMWHYAKALEEAGHSVTSSNSVDDAFTRLHDDTSRFDLVVLDVMMPPGRLLRNEAHLNGGHTGIYLALRLEKDFPNLPVVILTNSGDPEIQRKLNRSKSVRLILWKDENTPFELAEVLTKLLE